MKKVRILYFIAALYELIRVGLLFTYVLASVSPEMDQFIIILLMSLAAPGFVLIAGFLYMGIYPEKFHVSGIVLAIGKVSGLLPVLLIALHSIGLVRFQTETVRSPFMGFLFGIVMLFDLIFLLFLVSYKQRTDIKKEPDVSEQLPEMKEVKLED